ncbi:MAG: hypothetical protein K0S56_407 [Microvirga sp.]|jgi:hypothetical protein|nr:hypothetical protein [Microvirga sp.]
MISASALDDLRRKHLVTTAAGKWVVLRRSSKSGGMVGPCPVHSLKTGATAFECWSASQICPRCETHHG